MNLKKAAEYYPMVSSRYVIESIPRIEHWLEALKSPKSEFSRHQVAKDLMDLALMVAYDDGRQLGRVELARELLKPKPKKRKKECSADCEMCLAGYPPKKRRKTR